MCSRFPGCDVWEFYPPSVVDDNLSKCMLKKVLTRYPALVRARAPLWCSAHATPG